MPSLRRHLALLAVCCLSIAAYAQRTINVGPGQTYTTIQSGINAAVTGDTVLVAPGTYSENINFNGKGITVISSAGAASTTIDGQLKGPTVTFATSEPRTATLNGFSVINGAQVSGAGGPGGDIYINGSMPAILNNSVSQSYGGIDIYYASPLVQGNHVFSNGNNVYAEGAYIGSAPQQPFVITGNTIEKANGYPGIMLESPGTVAIQNNTIFNNNSTNQFGGGIELVDPGPNTLVAQNLIYGNTGYVTAGGLYIYANESTAGPGPADIFVVNNTIANNILIPQLGITPSTQLTITGVYGLVTAVNNIIVGSSSTVPTIACQNEGVISRTSLLADHNLVYNSTGPAYGGECTDPTGSFGNISADPKFVAATSGNYQLSTGSPAIDAGNNSAPSLLGTDLAAKPRVQDATGVGYPIVDMGAFEATGLLDASPTTIVLTPSAYIASTGSSLTLTAVFSSALGKPTGAATFFADGAQIGTALIDASGTAKLPNAAFTPGIHALYVTYAGQGSFTPAISVIVYVYLNLYATTLSLSSSPNPSIATQPVTFTVNVSTTGPGGPPSPVSLVDTSTNTTLATLTPNASGVATYTTSALALGYHQIKATYAGNSTTASATATVTQQVVSGYATTTALTSSLNPSNLNQSVTFTAKITATGSIPTGTVTFADGGVTLGSRAVDASGNASFATSTLAQGSRNITATFSGTGSYTGSSASLTQQVIGPTAQTITFPVPTPAVPGTTVQLTATASSNLAVGYTLISGPATLNGSLLTFTGLGTVVVQADQPGSTVYAAAPSVQDTISVIPLTEPVGTFSPTLTVTLTITTAGTLASIADLTLGVSNLDFTVAQLGSVNGQGTLCTPGTAYTVGQTCLIGLRFKPSAPGPRLGGLTAADANGVTLATAFLPGIGTGPQLIFLPGTQSVASTSVGRAVSFVADGANNLFVASQSTNSLIELTAASNYATAKVLSTAFPAAEGVAIDSLGNLFVTNASPATVTEIFAATNYTTSRLIGSGWSYPTGIAVDANGNVFVADYNLGIVRELTAASNYQTSTTLGGTYRVPVGLALDSNANLFITSLGDNTLRELSFASNYQTATKVATTISFPSSLAVDANNNLYVSDEYDNTAQEFLASSSYATQKTLTLTSVIAAIAFDSLGNLFSLDFHGNTLNKLDLVDAPTLTFASTPVGSTSPDSPQIATLYNNGNAPLVFGPRLTTLSTNFLLDAVTTCPQPLPNGTVKQLLPGTSCTDAVDFQPTVAGAITGTLTTPDNNLNSATGALVIPLKGAGVILPTTATLTVSPASPVTVGTNLIFTATVTAASGPPTGMVSFFASSISFLALATLNGGVATFSLSTLPPGTYTFGCTYTGSAGFSPSSCNSVNLTIVTAPTTLTLTTSANPLPALNALGITAHLVTTTGASPVAGASVVFLVDSAAAFTTTTDASGNALFSTSTLTPGAHTLSALFLGDPTHSSATATPLIETIFTNPTSVTLIAAPNPGTQNQPGTLVATVANLTGTAAPTGSIQFLDTAPGATTPTVLAVYPLQPPAPGAPTTLASATLVTSTLAPGTHIVKAVYVPATTAPANFYANASAPLSLVITPQSFTIAPAQPSLTIRTEHHASIAVSLTSIGGLSGRFSLACPSLPAYATCIFAQPSVYLPANGTVTTNLTIDTDVILGFKSSLEPTTLPAPANREARRTGLVALAFLLPLTLASTVRRRRLLRAMLPVLLLTALATTLTACGDKYPASTPPGTYTVPLTATGTPDNAPVSQTQTANLTLIVTP